MKDSTKYSIICFAWFSLTLILFGTLLGVFSHSSFGPTPEAVRRFPELQNAKHIK